MSCVALPVSALSPVLHIVTTNEHIQHAWIHFDLLLRLAFIMALTAAHCHFPMA